MKPIKHTYYLDSKLRDLGMLLSALIWFYSGMNKAILRIYPK